MSRDLLREWCRASILVTVLLGGTVPGVGSAPVAEPTTPDERLRSWEQHVRMEEESPFRELEWRPVGPMQSGARIEAIAVPPGEGGTFYVGVGSGNVWKTVNHGLTWEPIFESQSAFAVGDVAVSGVDPDVVWVGTGETQPRHSGYSYAGTGVFRSDDGGRSWRHLGLADTHHIGKVLLHPGDPDTAWVAALGHFRSRNRQRGVFKTVDGGRSWEQVLYVSDATGVVDLVIDPGDPDVLHAWAWQLSGLDPGAEFLGGVESGLYRSTDGGDSWARIDAGLPAGPLGRGGLAVSASDPHVVYAFIDNQSPYVPPEVPAEAESEQEDEDERERPIVGGELYRSDDGGLTWRRVDNADIWEVFGIYGWKFCDVRVSPVDPEEVFLLGNRAYVSSDGGATIERIGEEIRRLHDTRGEIMHLDHHELWIDPDDPDRLLLGNDGGLFVSWDRGSSWLHLNSIPAAEFYAVSVDMSEPYRIFGGTQDNAAVYGPGDVDIREVMVDPWENVYLDRWTGGDSFDTWLDPTDDRIVYYEHQHGAMRRMDITGESVLTGGPDAVDIRPQPPEADGEKASAESSWRFGWYTPFLISHHNPLTLYAGGNRLVKSLDRGESWFSVSPDLSDPGGGKWAVVPFGTITMIAESPFRPGLIWVGTEGGSVWRTHSDGHDWERVDAGLPDKWVSRLVASSHREGTLYAAFTGYREDDFGAYLYTSTDYGDTWASIAAGLPAESVNVVREDPVDPRVLYVGTDLGVYVSIDGGASWQSLCAGLPTTPVHDLVVHPREGEMVIGTHGRSAWVLDIEPVRAAAAGG